MSEWSYCKERLKGLNILDAYLYLKDTDTKGAKETGWQK